MYLIDTEGFRKRPFQVTVEPWKRLSVY